MCKISRVAVSFGKLLEWKSLTLETDLIIKTTKIGLSSRSLRLGLEDLGWIARENGTNATRKLNEVAGNTSTGLISEEIGSIGRATRPRGATATRGRIIPEILATEAGVRIIEKIARRTRCNSQSRNLGQSSPGTTTELKGINS